MLLDEYQNIFEKLTFTENNFQKYIYCPVRDKFKICSPEEEVRQTMIYFLLNTDISDKISVTVEENHADISVHLKHRDDNFNPKYPPLLIIELKNIFEDIENERYIEQIKGYCNISKCFDGILYNGKKLMYHNFDSGLKKEFYRMEEVYSIVKNKLTNPKFNDCSNLFNSAKNGDFDSFRKLGEEFIMNEFIVQIQEENTVKELSIGNLKFYPERVEYRYYNSYTPKRKLLLRSQFIALKGVS